ncbi:HNH endonuclease [Candidatus Babeliales bacterium]|nr:HNH endonuclease [Candidatus Babeliales bacterium]
MQSLRIQALLALGDKCVECGANDRRILHIDHIDGKGHKERKKAKRGEMNLKIINGDTENYQLLCANCHAIKTWEQRGYRNPNQ